MFASISNKLIRFKQAHNITKFLPSKKQSHFLFPPSFFNYPYSTYATLTATQQTKFDGFFQNHKKKSSDDDYWVIDTDCGIDDAQALIIGLKYLNPRAFIASGGNSSRQNVIKNISRVLEVANKQVPIWIGADQPMIQQNIFDPIKAHGQDGLGDRQYVKKIKGYSQCIDNTAPPYISSESGISAVLRLVSLINENPGKVNIIAIGPLTTLAMAISLDRSISKKIKSFHCMGGAYLHKGNQGPLRPAVQYNFGFDAFATRIVLDNIPMTNLVTWQLVQEYGKFSREEIEKKLFFNQKGDQKICKFFQQIHQFQLSNTKFDPKLYYCDGLSAACAVDWSIVTGFKEVYSTIELDSFSTRGAMFIDWDERMNMKPNVRIITSIDKNKALDVLERSLKDNE